MKNPLTYQIIDIKKLLNEENAPKLSKKICQNMNVPMMSNRSKDTKYVLSPWLIGRVSVSCQGERVFKPRQYQYI